MAAKDTGGTRRDTGDSSTAVTADTAAATGVTRGVAAPATHAAMTGIVVTGIRAGTIAATTGAGTEGTTGGTGTGIATGTGTGTATAAGTGAATATGGTSAIGPRPGAGGTIGTAIARGTTGMKALTRRLRPEPQLPRRTTAIRRTESSDLGGRRTLIDSAVMKCMFRIRV